MPSPIKKGRWKTPEEIIEKIGEVTRKIMRYRLAADELNATAKKAHRQEKHALAAALTEQSNAKIAKADRLENGYLQKLKRKLAEINTSLLPNTGIIDTSIPK